MKRHNLYDAVSESICDKYSRLSYDLKTSSYSKYGMLPSSGLAMMGLFRGQSGVDCRTSGLQSAAIRGDLNIPCGAAWKAGS